MFDLERLLKVARLKQNQFSELMGVTDSAISKLKQGKMNLPEEWKTTIFEKLGLNADDFITDQVREPELRYLGKGVKPDSSSPQRIPLYSLNVEAGFESGLESSPDYIEGYIQMPGIGKNEGSWIVSGHSMYPTISKGSRVVLRKVENWELLEWNNIYVIDINEMGPKVKRIKKGHNKDYFILASDNKEFESMEIEKKEIKSIHRVLLAFEMF